VRPPAADPDRRRLAAGRPDRVGRTEGLERGCL